MISVTYQTGKVRQFDSLAEGDRRTLIVSLMTVSEMVRFFAPGEATVMAISLGLPATGTETIVCRRIHTHFHKA
jgi:glutamate-1-semialdehyde aminotransferase